MEIRSDDARITLYSVYSIPMFLFASMAKTAGFYRDTNSRKIFSLFHFSNNDMSSPIHVLVTGSRQVGKTTLIETLSQLLPTVVFTEAQHEHDTQSKSEASLVRLMLALFSDNPWVPSPSKNQPDIVVLTRCGDPVLADSIPRPPTMSKDTFSNMPAIEKWRMQLELRTKAIHKQFKDAVVLPFENYSIDNQNQFIEPLVSAILRIADPACLASSLSSSSSSCKIDVS